MEACAAEMSLPQDITLPGRPIPRNESVASATMKTPSSMVASTMIGASALGSTWLTRDPTGETPSDRAAVTKSALRTSMTAPRVMRAICGQPSTTRTRTTVQTPRFSRKSGSWVMTRAPRMSGQGEEDIAEAGNDGIHPAAEEAGQGTEGDADDQHTQITEKTPTISEAWVPWMMRE